MDLEASGFSLPSCVPSGKQHHVPDALSRVCRSETASFVGVVSKVSDQGGGHPDGNCCAASRCVRPDEELIDWIQCDDCDNWYHQTCVNIDPQEAEDLDRYSCPSCVGKEGSEEEPLVSLHLSRESVIVAQRSDDLLRPLVQKLEKDDLKGEVQSPKLSTFRLKDGMLYKGGCVVIPKALQNDVLVECHSKPVAGHLGRRKTLGRLKSMALWWNGMSRSVRSFVRSCKVCRETKPVYQRRQGKMLSTTTSKPWEKVGVDLMGPLPQSYAGHTYILVAVDHFSKYTEILPLKTATSRTVATALVKELFCRYGPPEALVTDNGPQFRGKAMNAVCKDWGVEQVFITPYHPQTNWVERVNRNVKAMLQAFTGTDHRQWDVHLAELAFALNSSIHDTLGVEPSVVVFGRRLATPLTNRLKTGVNPDIPAAEEIAANRLQAVQSSRRHYDRGRDDCRIVVGEEVMVKTYPQSNASKIFSAKLAPRWTGPFIVENKLTPVNFRLVNVRDPTVTRIAHADQLKKC